MADRWEEYLASFLDEEKKETAVAWYDSRPESIRSMIRRFPPGSSTIIDGHEAWVVSYHEASDGGAAGVSFSHVDPSRQYREAMASRFFVCADHITPARGVPPGEGPSGPG